MKQEGKKRTRQPKEMLEEYDFSQGVRGKYAKRFAEGSNLVVIAPEIAKFFPDSESVNEALRGLLKIIQRRTQSRKAG